MFGTTIEHILAGMAKEGSVIGFWDTIDDVNRAKDAFAAAGICVSTLMPNQCGGQYVLYTPMDMCDELREEFVKNKCEALLHSEAMK